MDCHIEGKKKIFEFACGHKQQVGKGMLWIATLKAHAELSSQMLLCQESDSNFVCLDDPSPGGGVTLDGDGDGDGDGELS